MESRRLSRALIVGALALAACGGSSDSPAVGADAADVAGSVTPSPDDVDTGDSGDADAGDTSDSGDTGDSGDSGDASDGAGLSAAPLTPLWSIPVNGVALGSEIAMSPDGSQVAFVTGGIEPQIQIHDAATGDVVNSAPYNGQGLELVWTNANQLVSWDPERLHVIDAATLDYPGAVELTITPGAEECPTSVFSIRFDRASDAMFAADFHESGTIVCRIDIGATTITATVIEGRAGLSDAFLRPETGELVVAYSVESSTGNDSVAVLDAVTLDVKSSGPTPGGESVTAATATDLVVKLDRETDGFASTGQPIAARATGDRFGQYLVGSSTGQLVLMDATTGAALFAGAEQFRPTVGTDDGSKLAVLRADTLDFFVLG